jgi:hypothetical protein
MKYYIELCICIIIKAMHLKTDPNLTSEAFIAVLKALIIKRDLIITSARDKYGKCVVPSREMKALFKSEAFLGRRVTVARTQISVGFYCSEFTSYWRTVESRREVLIV